jgi:acetyl esterase/lipase
VKRFALLVLIPLCLLTQPETATAQGRRWQPPAGVEWTRDVVYGQGGGRELKLDVLEPAQAPETLRPALIYVHGGGWARGDKRAGLGLNAEYAARGYYTVTVQYRLTHEAIYPAQIEDVKAAVRWVRAQAAAKRIDPARIGIWGHSAGGHLASLAATAGDVDALEGRGGHSDQASRVACVVDVFGPTDLTRFEFDPDSRWSASARQLLKAFLGGPHEERLDLAAQASPVEYVTPDDPPVLIVHGTADPLVPFRQAELFQSALQQAGVDVTLVAVEGAGHGWRPSPRIDERIARFFARHLEGADVEVEGGSIVPGSE